MIDFSYKDIKTELKKRVKAALIDQCDDREAFDKEFDLVADKLIKKIALRGLHKIVTITRANKGRILLQAIKLQQFYYDFTDLVDKSSKEEFDLDEARGLTPPQAKLIKLRKKLLKNQKRLLGRKSKREKETMVTEERDNNTVLGV